MKFLIKTEGGTEIEMQENTVITFSINEVKYEIIINKLEK